MGFLTVDDWGGGGGGGLLLNWMTSIKDFIPECNFLYDFGNKISCVVSLLILFEE